eukprot:gnl/Dysnectes_brevis/5757_a8474_417.p1 GENE.gnl/Dysnectes_brevis/5757_a8474_417~~gnl/Dysnectes_brevis/5757_a8474_417.p1  ORF type:complete len:368 (+),score=68.41 gnl/Dysnectes_brevis/5757_a8474_417:52-1155(+)
MSHQSIDTASFLYGRDAKENPRKQPDSTFSLPWNPFLCSKLSEVLSTIWVSEDELEKGYRALNAFIEHAHSPITAAMMFKHPSLLKSLLQFWKREKKNTKHVTLAADAMHALLLNRGGLALFIRLPEDLKDHIIQHHISLSQTQPKACWRFLAALSASPFRPLQVPKDWRIQLAEAAEETISDRIETRPEVGTYMYEALTAANGSHEAVEQMLSSSGAVQALGPSLDMQNKGLRRAALGWALDIVQVDSGALSSFTDEVSHILRCARDGDQCVRLLALPLLELLGTEASSAGLLWHELSKPQVLAELLRGLNEPDESEVSMLVSCLTAWLEGPLRVKCAEFIGVMAYRDRVKSAEFETLARIVTNCV